MDRIIKRLLAALLVLHGIGITAAQTADAPPRLGKDFVATPLTAGGKTAITELVEFFMYRCPHCRRSFESSGDWHPAGTIFLRVPAVFMERDLAHARMYYALSQLNAPTETHLAVMRAIQVERKALGTRDEQAAFLAEHGVDAERYAAAWDSPGVSSAVTRAVQLVRRLDVPGTPAVVINGQFLTTPSMAGDIDSMRRTALYLAARLKAGEQVTAQVENSTSSPGPSGGASTMNMARSPGVGSQWPVGVEPGNLYLIKYGSAESHDLTLVVAATTKSEASAVVEKAITARNEVYRVGIERNPGSKIVLKEVLAPQECVGPNWGATVTITFGTRGGASGSSCGHRTTREAIHAASNVCSSKAGKPCSTTTKDAGFLVVSVGHSGANPWGGLKNGFGRPALTSFPNPGMVFSALGASTQQSTWTNQYIQSPEDAISKFGKACGANHYGRDTHSCWITSKNLDCIINATEDPRDRMTNQHKCVDTRLTAEGYVR